MHQPTKGEIYRHYKRGTTYRITCVAVIEATEEPCLVYEALYPEAEHRFWIRPLAEFCGFVEKDGTHIPRFCLVEHA